MKFNLIMIFTLKLCSYIYSAVCILWEKQIYFIFYDDDVCSRYLNSQRSFKIVLVFLPKIFAQILNFAKFCLWAWSNKTQYILKLWGKILSSHVTCWWTLKFMIVFYFIIKSNVRLWHNLKNCENICKIKDFLNKLASSKVIFSQSSRSTFHGKIWEKTVILHNIRN